jgi:hypothetical protein
MHHAGSDGRGSAVLTRICATLAAAMLGVLWNAACSDDPPPPPPLDPNHLRVVVRVRDFVEFSKLPPRPEQFTGDLTTFDVIDSPGYSNDVSFQVLHPGAAPDESLWRDVGASYEITLHRGFLTNAAVPPRPDQILRPIVLKAKPDPKARPQHWSLSDPHRCDEHLVLIAGAPLPLVEGPGFAGVVLPEKAVQAAKLRCAAMKDDPFETDGYWTPSDQDVRALEAKLPQYCREHRIAAHPYAWNDLGSYARQYAGFVSEGKRFIQVALIHFRSAVGWRCRVLDLCYTVHRSFAAVFDVNAGAFTRAIPNPGSIDPDPIP